MAMQGATTSNNSNAQHHDTFDTLDLG